MTGQPFHAHVDKFRADTRGRIGELIRAAVPSVAPGLAIGTLDRGRNLVLGLRVLRDRWHLLVDVEAYLASYIGVPRQDQRD